MSHFYFLDKARQESLKSSYKYRLGAVLVRKGKIISRGYNKISHNPLKFFRKWDNSIHAEIDCIIKAPYEMVEGSTLYIFRELKTGELAMARPCEFCLAYIHYRKLKKIVYTISEYPGYLEEKI